MLSGIILRAKSVCVRTNVAEIVVFTVPSTCVHEPLNHGLTGCLKANPKTVDPSDIRQCLLVSTQEVTSIFFFRA